jgi:replicative DNA helicase
MRDRDPRLPRADEAEKYLVTCIVGFPDRAPEIIPLVKAKHFFDPLYQKIWKAFNTQLLTSGAVNPLAVGRLLDCAADLLELGYESVTTAHAESRAEMVREAATGRALYEVCRRAADAILRGRTADSVRAQLHLALDGFEAEAVSR